MGAEGFADFRGFRIWYHVADARVSGAPTTPLLLLHGGPGAGSDVFEPLDELAESGRSVVRFDQLGGGRSDRPRDVSLWTIGSCLEQIEVVRATLGLERVHLVGHSWGGMLALEYVLGQRSGVRSACLASPVVSVGLWVEEARRLRNRLPRHVAAALDRCERSLTPRPPPPPRARPDRTLTHDEIDRKARLMRLGFPVLGHPASARVAAWLSHFPPARAAAYEVLGLQFVLRHVCRLRPAPLGLFRMLAGMNKEVYETLWGPSEFHANGSLAGWDIRPRLSEVRVPTLILSGVHDEATPGQMAVLREAIAGAEQALLADSAHCGMWEEPEAFRRILLDFVHRVERGEDQAGPAA